MDYENLGVIRKKNGNNNVMKQAEMVCAVRSITTILLINDTITFIINCTKEGPETITQYNTSFNAEL